MFPVGKIEIVDWSPEWPEVSVARHWPSAGPWAIARFALTISAQHHSGPGRQAHHRHPSFGGHL